jgi:RNA polymerase sigma factor (sigma-70 family)
MAAIPLHHVLDHLRQLHRVADAAQRSDCELLHAFATKHDEDAFAVVVRRHAALVWGVCRRILRHQQDAEDAFQATFVILARRAGSTRWRPSVGGWLHTVAQRLAVRVRQQAEQRRNHEREASRVSQGDSSLCELAAVVDEELQRLPAKYREPLLLHYLEGMTAETTARQLGLSHTTFYSRLAYGRELLRERLSRQGLTLAAPLLIAALTPEAKAASRSLIQATLRGVMGSMPERVAALVTEAMGATAMTKLKIGLALGLLLSLSASGVAMLTPPPPMEPRPQAQRPAEPPKAEDKAALRRDRYGDPLPPGAIARLGTLRFRVESEGNMIHELTFAPDGKTLVVASLAGLSLFDAATGKQMKRIHPPYTYFWQVAFSPDGKRLLAAFQVMNPGQQKSGVQIWDTVSGKKTTEVELKDILHLGWMAESQPLVACQDKEAIFLHEISTGRKRRFSAKDLAGPLSPRCAVGKKVLAAYGKESGVIHVWELTRGEERWSLKTGGDFSLSHSLVLSPDERWLASLSGTADKNTLQLWDLTTGEARSIFTGDQRRLASAAFTRDGKTLATIGQQEVHFWDTASGRERGRLKGEGRSFNTSAVAFAPDGKTLATMEGLCGAIHLWNVATGELRPGPEGHSTNWVRTPVFSPDGKRVTTSGGLDCTIRVWETKSGRPLALLRGSPSTVLQCALSADGRTLVSCWDDKLLLSDAATGRELHVLETNDWRQHKGRANMRMHVSNDGRKAIVFRSVSESGGAGAAPAGGGFESDWLITCWDTTKRKQLFRRQLAYHDSERNLAVSPDAKIFALPGAKREPMRLEDVETGERLLTFPTLKGNDTPLVFSGDGRLLLSYFTTQAASAPRGYSRALRLWEVQTASELLILPVSIYFFATAAFSPDGRLLATIAPEGEILLWDLRSGKELRRFKDFDSSVTSLTFSSDSRRLVSGLYNSTLLVWDVPLPETAPAGKLGSEGVAKAWADLAAKDAPRAFHARWALASAPEKAMPLLTKHLHPARPADPQRLRQLVADLESEQFTVREKAQEELAKLGDLAEPALRRTLDNKPTLEARRRVQAVLERLRGPVTRPEMLQALRAVAVLEDIGTPEARRLLEELVQGAPEARLTREAEASLRRLALRGSIPSRDR